jgi:small subunit ribosomal protein S4
MARYRAAKSKIARNLGEAIFGYDKHFEKRKYASGQHGNSRKRKQKSEYAIQLKEKQKAKYTYGLLERQFANLFDKAARKSGITGTILLQLLESRLDNIVFRLGLSNSRNGARQLVSHKHITVNGKICNIPSAHIKETDIIGVRTKSLNMTPIVEALDKKPKLLNWISFNREKMEGKMSHLPSRDEIPENINEQLIVELYSK